MISVEHEIFDRSNYPFLFYLQLGFTNLSGDVDRTITLEKALQVTKDVFISAAERDIYTGDALHVYVITAAGIEEKKVELRKD